jgi:hypothetical protein
MLGILGATVALLTSRRQAIKEILWLPDRDVISFEWQGMSRGLFHANLHSALYHRFLPDVFLLIAPSDGVYQKQSFDPYIRIPDFYATPAASVCRTSDGAQKINGIYAKAEQIVEEAFFDNSQFSFTFLSFGSENGMPARYQFEEMKFSSS